MRLPTPQFATVFYWKTFKMTLDQTRGEARIKANTGCVTLNLRMLQTHLTHLYRLRSHYRMVLLKLMRSFIMTSVVCWLVG